MVGRFTTSSTTLPTMLMVELDMVFLLRYPVTRGPVRAETTRPRESSRKLNPNQNVDDAKACGQRIPDRQCFALIRSQTAVPIALNERRYAVGATPVCRWKWWRSRAAVPKPDRCAMISIGS